MKKIEEKINELKSLIKELSAEPNERVKEIIKKQIETNRVILNNLLEEIK